MTSSCKMDSYSPTQLTSYQTSQSGSRFGGLSVYLNVNISYYGNTGWYQQNGTQGSTWVHFFRNYKWKMCFIVSFFYDFHKYTRKGWATVLSQKLFNQANNSTVWEQPFSKSTIDFNLMKWKNIFSVRGWGKGAPALLPEFLKRMHFTNLYKFSIWFIEDCMVVSFMLHYRSYVRRFM